MYVATYPPSSHSSSKYSNFLLRLVNTFTIDTGQYYPVFYKVNDANNFKISYLYCFMHANHHIYYRLACLTVVFKIIAIDF